MFSIKNFDSITASIINNIIAMSSELTDFNVGSNVRTLIEANAREMDQLYQALLKGLYESIPVAIYKAFDFQKLSAGYASGYVRFTRTVGVTGDIVIPEGTTVESPEDGLTYTVSSETTMAAEDDYLDVYVLASGTGTSFNIAANAISQLNGTIYGISDVTNNDAFTNGTDDETEIERKLRFQLWLSTIPRAIETAIEYGATTACLLDDNGIPTESVVKAIVHEPCVDEDPPGDVGQIDIYIWNGLDGASEELIEEAQKVIDGYVDDTGTRIPGWKAAGVIATVYAVDPDPVNVTLTVTIRQGYDSTAIVEAIDEAIRAYISTLEIGQPFIVTEVIDAAMNIAGVYDVVVSAPAANYSPSWNDICVPGDIAISEASTTW